MKCTLYRNAKDNIGNPVDLANVLAGIKNGRWRDAILEIRNSEKAVADELKKSLPGATFSGTFFPTRAKENVQTYNHLLVFDIDHLDVSTMQRLLPALKEDAHVMAAWVSPSGTGIKGLIPVTSDQTHHLDAFECIAMYFESNYAVAIDPSGKDECRLCFVSYDPNLFFNPDAVRMPIEYRSEARKTMYGDREFSKKGLSITSDDRVKYDVSRKWAEYYRHYEEGRNNHVFLCACNMNRTGIEMERAIVLVIADRTDLPVAETKSIITKVYRSKAKEFNTIEVYDFEKEQEEYKGSLVFMSLDEMFDDFDSDTSERGIAFGDDEIDKVIGGLQNGNLYGFIGPEKTYKSTFAMAVARRTSEFHGPVLYLSGEMSKNQALRNFILPYGIDVKDKEQVTAHRERLRAITTGALRRLMTVPGDGFTKESVLATCKQIESGMGEPVRLIVVDGIQNWHKIRGTEHEQDSTSTKQMKEVAKDSDVPVIVILHTDASCRPWYRQPSAFVRSKTVVRRNLDAYFDFSRFIEPNGKFESSQGREYDLRKDYCYLNVKDERNSGDSVGRVFAIAGLNPVPRPDLDVNDFEIKIEQNDGYQRS